MECPRRSRNERPHSATRSGDRSSVKGPPGFRSPPRANSEFRRGHRSAPSVVPDSGASSGPGGQSQPGCHAVSRASGGPSVGSDPGDDGGGTLARPPLLPPAGARGSPRGFPQSRDPGKGKPATLLEMPPVDPVVVGSVAVGRQGACVGKGGKLADLEFVLLTEGGKVGLRTVVATTVHETQVSLSTLPRDPYDAPPDLVVTPRGLLRMSWGKAPAPGPSVVEAPRRTAGARP